MVALSVLWVGIPFTLFPIAEQHISSAVTGLLNGAMPLFTALFAALFFGTRTRGGQLLGVGIGFVGVVAISLPSATEGGTEAWGVALVLLATLCYGLAINIAAPLQARYGSRPLMARMLALATLWTLPYGLVGLPSTSLAVAPVLAVAVLGLVGTGLAFLIMGTLVGRIGSTRASFITYLIPVVALVLGVVVQHDRVAPLALVGVALVIGGAILASRAESPAPAPSADGVPAGDAPNPLGTGRPVAGSLSAMRIGIVGATGQVGGVMRNVLDQRAFPAEEVRFLASARSAGTTLPWEEREITVEDVATADLSSLDIVIMSAGATASRATGRGHRRLRAGGHRQLLGLAPAPRGPPGGLRGQPRGGRASGPRASSPTPTAPPWSAMPPLAALHRAAGLEALVVSTYQAVSGGRPGRCRGAADPGRGGRDQGLRAHPRRRRGRLPRARQVPRHRSPSTWCPSAGSYVDDGLDETDEDQKLRFESRKILDIPDLPVSGLCVRVPVFTGHSLSINARFARSLSPAEATELLAEAPGVALHELPTPLLAAGADPAYVGRIRADETVPDGRGLALFVSGDNLRKGAALNTIQIAELVAAGG